ncbi:hypothetical protein CspeluHIS016_0800660 [Cutaneotrichosporon spelunceum]|uniref:Uncharacterized protein n=1 Tax=Cutaneotrichosporon spelunceum TaxID=1672016 RepID=A0AAD3TYX9_9TREE|nr:hypothetical protein CspeluHIS016_0800660 [Cutaneotrichosporon spelunceum]
MMTAIDAATNVLSSENHRTRERERDVRDDRDERKRRGGERSRRGRRDRSRERSPRGSYDRAESPRRRRERSPNESSDDLFDLEDIGVERITEEDYFLKAGEFRFWLKEERGKYLDQLSSADAHKYFRRFVRRWNDGALPRACYAAHKTAGSLASDNTAYKWKFTANSRFNSVELAATRESVERATHSKLHHGNAETTPGDDSDGDIGPVLEPSSPSPGPQLVGPSVGPSAPTVAERQMAREVQAEREHMERSAERRAGRKVLLERAEEHAPRQTGKEGRQAEKRATNQQNKQIREKDSAAGLEVDDDTLMGDDSSFAAALRARDGASSRRADRKAEEAAERRAAHEERLVERRQKDSETMEMLKTMARQRYGA